MFTADRPDGTDAQVTVEGDRLAALQQPGPDADTVVVESVARAVQVPLDGGVSPGGVVVGEQVNRVPGATVLSRPVVLDGCVQAAWAEQNRVFYGANCGRAGEVPTATLPADGKEPTRDGVAFRVNRGLVVLNDLDNGGVWDLDDKPTKIDDWDALTPPTRQDKKNDKKDENLVDEAALQQPPKAMPDSEQVRPGRTSKLHVLDNDTDVAGSVLAIDQRDVTAPDLDGVTATVSADGQAVDVSVPPNAEGRTFAFSYKVNNGKVVSKESAKVTVRVVGDEVNAAPHLRPGGAALADAGLPGDRRQAALGAGARRLARPRERRPRRAGRRRGRDRRRAGPGHPHRAGGGRAPADRLPRHRRPRRHHQGHGHRPGGRPRR